MSTALNKGLAQDSSKSNLEWNKLSSIPDNNGFAGSFAGVSHGALLVAGGSNFPDGGTPWTGSKKVWSDKIYVLEKQDGGWKEAGKLPQPLGYGVSVNWRDALIILGGSNEKGHHAEVLMLNYKNGEIEIKSLPDLPYPIANTSGVLLDNVIYIAGGIRTPDAPSADQNFWALDLAAAQKSWKVLKSWPGPARMLSVAGTQNGAVYLFSGAELINGNRKYLKDAYEYLPGTGWKQLADLPDPVVAAPTPAYAADSDHLFIFGGDDGVLAPKAAELKEKHPGFSKQILDYHVLTNTWTVAGEMSTDRAPVTTTLTIWNGNIVIPGGEVRPAVRTPNVLMAIPVKHP